MSEANGEAQVALAATVAGTARTCPGGCPAARWCAGLRAIGRELLVCGWSPSAAFLLARPQAARVADVGPHQVLCRLDVLHPEPVQQCPVFAR
jgi:hypothetical protein